MPSKFNLHLISAVTLTALLLLLRASGAPVEDSPTDSPAGDPSGDDGEEPSDLLSASQHWDLIRSQHHKKEFEDEFQSLKYHTLTHFKSSSFPEACPKSNFSKEACLQRLAEGLHIYTALLKHVEKEYPGNSIVSELRSRSPSLLKLIKDNMKNSDRVTALTSSQEEQLLKDLDNPDAFHRKMTAHSILKHLFIFLLDGKRAIIKKENLRARVANKVSGPISLHHQM